MAPLVMIAFNRPDLLRDQLKIIRQVHRGQIFCVVDGPRASKVGESEKVAEVVELLRGLDREYDVKYNLAESNLGCYQRIKTGLDWVFSQTGEAIILEDDCMPGAHFFVFANQMLERYAKDERIFSIAGTNLFPELSLAGQSYFFSRYANCWGWATWARAWQHFIDPQEEWEKIRETAGFCKSFRNWRSFLYWRHVFDRVYGGKTNSWAYRWMLTCWMQSGLSVNAHVNLIANVGDGADATHTARSTLTRRELGEMSWPLLEPKYVIPNALFDAKMEDAVYSKSSMNRLRWCFGIPRR